jgi:hypothetical protein
MSTRNFEFIWIEIKVNFKHLVYQKSFFMNKMFSVLKKMNFNDTRSNF